MMAYQRLDAWKVCHELTLAVYRATKEFPVHGDDLRGQLRHVALMAPAKLAHGAARQQRGTVRRCVDLAAGFLAELAYLLRVAREFGLLGNGQWQELDALRGRAAFYTWKLYLSLVPKPGGDAPTEP